MDGCPEFDLALRPPSKNPGSVVKKMRSQVYEGSHGSYVLLVAESRSGTMGPGPSPRKLFHGPKKAFAGSEKKSSGNILGLDETVSLNSAILGDTHQWHEAK